MFMTFDEHLHSFITYGFVGALVAYLLVKVLIKLRGIDNPSEISRLMMLPLFMPFLAVAASYLLINNQCPSVLGKETGIYGALNALCATTYGFSDYFLPILFAGFALAIVKAVASQLLCYVSATKNEVRDSQLADTADNILRALSVKAGIVTPKLIVSKFNFARCFTFGYRKPVIVISQGILKYFTEEEIEAILAHEIGHILRADSIKSWLIQTLRDVLFFNPIVFLVFRELRNENEKAADDIAITLTDKPIVFAETLIKFWKYSPKGFDSRIFAFSAGLNFAKDIDGLEERVKRSIGDELESKKRTFTVFAHSAGIVMSTLGLLLIVC